MTPIVVLTVICVAGIAFLLRFLVALFQETKRHRANVVFVPSSDRNFPRFTGSVLDFEPAGLERFSPIVEDNSQRAMAGHD
jgi:hypothetical protein